MKYLFSILLLFITHFIFGQNGAPNESAQQLHEEALVILKNEKASAFNKVEAIGKLRQCQQLINSNDDTAQQLKKETELKIIELADHFYALSKNPDSLLELTRFYPDSVFQADQRYADDFKSLLMQVLDLKKRKGRREFYQTIGTKNTHPIKRGNGEVFVFSFDDYWPLEVIEFDEELNTKEKEWNIYPKKMKRELLTSFYKNKLNNLHHWKQVDSLNYMVQNVERLKNNTDKKILESTKEYLNLRNIFIGIIGLLLLIGFFVWQKSNNAMKNMNQRLLEEKQRSDELLLNILPAEVARQLKNKASARAHKYDEVSVLFSDFQNFSKISEQLTPEELVKELDYCFTAFDRIFDKYRLQKIKTIGDAYMAVGGLYTQGSKHVRRMIYAALEIQVFLDNEKKRRMAEGKHFFEARIGIHKGPVVAGVVGTKKFVFDIWGNTVNIAQQMEAHGQAGKVNISGEAHAEIINDFNCMHRGKIKIKNTKEFDMYFVVKEK